jgi:hypothetical protein
LAEFSLWLSSTGLFETLSLVNLKSVRWTELFFLFRRFLDAYFITSFYKMILKKKIALADMESVDAEIFRSLTWML